MCSEIQDGGEVAEPTKVEIVALSEKATPENTKKQQNMELRFLTVSLYENEEIFQVIISSKQTLKPFIQINSAVCFTNWNMTTDSESAWFVISRNKWLFDY